MAQLTVVGGNTRRRLPLVGMVVIITVAGVMMWVVWRSPNRSDLATFWSLAVAIAAAATPLMIYLAKRSTPGNLGRVERLDQLTEALAGAVKEQWTRAAAERQLLYPEPIPVRWERSSKPIAGSPSSAAMSAQFPPLPGLAPCPVEQLLEGDLQDLHTVYGGLGSGRLVVVGAPGSGKSGAAVLLVLGALRYREQVHREDRPLVPVPVMCTFGGWDPAAQHVADWLAGQLRESFPFLTRKGGTDDAAVLLAAGRVAVVIDGLDEMPAGHRRLAIQALNRQATMRIVVLSRDAEMLDATTHDVLQGAAALELQHVRPDAAADYLMRVQRHPAPAGWNEMTDRLRHDPDSPIAAALSSPLTLTLVRDTYRHADDVRELLALCDSDSNVSREAIEDHLLDRVLPCAYTSRPGEHSPRYNFPKAERWMGHIATRMNQDCTRDLVWWRVRTWKSSGLYIVMTLLVCILIGTLVGGLGFGEIGAIIGGLAYGLYWLVGAGLLLRVRQEFPTPPSLSVPLRWQRLFRPLPIAIGTISGLVFGLTGWLAVGLMFGIAKGITAGVVFSLSSGLLGWVGGWLGSTVYSLSDEDYISPLTARTSWRHVQGFGLLTGVRMTLIAALVIWLGTGRIVVALAGALVAGLMGTVVTPQTWPASLAFVQLAIRGDSPVRMIRFLEDARKRGVLRTVGPVYQFRHARLQDRLALRTTLAAAVPAVTMQPIGDIRQPPI